MKQRLVGAAVIVALAVVIIPMLLNGSGNHGVREIPPAPQAPAASGQGAVNEQSIPLPPGESESAAAGESAPTVTAPEPTQPAAPSAPAAAAPAAMAQPQASTPAAVPEPKTAPSSPAAAPQPKPAEPPTAPAEAQSPKALTSWVIQVGSFSEQSKAIALRDRLRKADFPAFVERFVGADKRPMYRVRVGPELDRAKAEAMQKRLQEQQKLKGFVTQHS